MQTPYNERGHLLSPSALKRRFVGIDQALWRRLEGVFPVRVTRSWADRVRSIDGPLGLQVFPVASELDADPLDVADPVGEEGRMPVPWVISKHKDRALLLVTRQCHLHCRYCFRRDLDGESEPSRQTLDAAIAHLRASGVKEVILSGGDPLVLSTPRLRRIIDALRPDIPLIRIHTRAPITCPSRVDSELVVMLQRCAPLWMVVHCNHPAEISVEVASALGRLVDAGIPVLNQSVLLKGVNDDVEVLTELSEALLALRVKPYYLHHPDAVVGGGAFRVTVQEGLALHNALRHRVSGLGLPAYVIDPPEGTGKVPVAEWVANSLPSGE